MANKGLVLMGLGLLCVLSFLTKEINSSSGKTRESLVLVSTPLSSPLSLWKEEKNKKTVESGRGRHMDSCESTHEQ